MMLLQLAYGANIVILLPVALATMVSSRGAAAAIESKFAVDTPYRVLVGCLWTAILVCSVLGLFFPATMVGILMLQIFYKSLFLVLFLFPLWRSKGMKAVPIGLTGSFVAIVLLWPPILWLSYPWG